MNVTNPPTAAEFGSVWVSSRAGEGRHREVRKEVSKEIHALALALAYPTASVPSLCVCVWGRGRAWLVTLNVFKFNLQSWKLMMAPQASSLFSWQAPHLHTHTHTHSQEFGMGTVTGNGMGNGHDIEANWIHFSSRSCCALPFERVQV